MTDRVNGFTVHLDRDIREDDVEVIANAIRMIKGVVRVDNKVVGPMDHIAYMRGKREITDKLYKFLNTMDKD